jgi:hypothetical protein
VTIWVARCGGLLQGTVTWPEGVPNPLDRVTLDCNDVESHNAVRESRTFGEKQRSRTNEFPLLMDIYGQPGRDEVIVGSITYLDEDKTLSVQHNQVDFAEAALKVASDRLQAIVDQESVSAAFGLGAYSSRVSSSHDSSSAASGICNSGSSEMS